MATKLTYEKLCDICYARNTEHFWLVNAVDGVKVSLKYDDCAHTMDVTIGGIISVGFDKCSLSELSEEIVNLYRKDVFVGVLNIKHLEVWE